MKKAVQRMCIGCSEKKDKKELIRVVINKNSEIALDKTGKLEGRGAYICDNEECLDKAIKSKKLERLFEIKIEQEIYDNVRDMMNDKKNKVSSEEIKSIGGDVNG